MERITKVLVTNSERFKLVETDPKYIRVAVVGDDLSLIIFGSTGEEQVAYAVSMANKSVSQRTAELRMKDRTVSVLDKLKQAKSEQDIWEEFVALISGVKQCQWCGKFFEPAAKQSKYCCNKCRTDNKRVEVLNHYYKQKYKVDRKQALPWCDRHAARIVHRVLELAASGSEDDAIDFVRAFLVGHVSPEKIDK